MYCGLENGFYDYMNSKKSLISRLSKMYLYYNRKNLKLKINGNIKYNSYYTKNVLNNINTALILQDRMNKKDKKYFKDVVRISKNLKFKNNKIFNNKDSINLLNFWEIVLFLDKKINSSWYDVENSIKDFLIPNNNKKYSKLEYLEKLFKLLKNKSIVNVGEIDSEIFFLFFVSYNFLGLNKYNTNKICDFLIDQLRIFEKSFFNYLNDEIKLKDNDNDITNIYSSNFAKTNSINYTAKITYLINKISKNRNVNVLNFNYTQILSFHPRIGLNEKYKFINDRNFNVNQPINLFNNHIKKSTNINGALTIHNNDIKMFPSKIIFGIDDNILNIKNLNNKELSNIKRFTKSERKKEIDFENNPLDKIDTILDKNNISKIMFFGHSLGESDFSYFKYIFDYYDIYKNNNVKFVFIYAIHKSRLEISKMSTDEYNKNDINQKNKQIKKVKSLMNNYDETNNKKHILYQNKLSKNLIDFENIENFL